MFSDIARLLSRFTSTLLRAPIAIVGLVGSIASIVSAFVHEEQIDSALKFIGIPHYVLPWILIFIFGFSLICFVFVFSEKEREIEKFSILFLKHKTLFRKLNAIAGQKYGIFEKIFLAKCGEPTQIDQNLVTLLNHFKELFSQYTGNSCSVSVKILSYAGSNNEEIYTLSRDSVSASERSQVDLNLPEYSYHDNTAFEYVVNQNSRYSFFLCNNLLKLEEQQAYKNKNPYWKDYYNATLVASISPYDNPKLNQTIGFICVDNMEGGFDEDFCAQVILNFGKELFQLFYAYDNIVEDDALDSGEKNG